VLRRSRSILTLDRARNVDEDGVVGVKQKGRRHDRSDARGELDDGDVFDQHVLSQKAL